MSETSDQVALFSLINRLAGLDEYGKPIPDVTPRYPLLRFAFHPANERRDKLESIKAARMGQRAGVWDIWFPVLSPEGFADCTAGAFVGCVIEMKSGTGRLSPEQRDWLEHLKSQRWYTAVFTDWTNAASLLIRYAGGNSEEIEGL